MYHLLKKLFPFRKKDNSSPKVLLLQKPALVEVDLLDLEDRIMLIVPLGGVREQDIEVKITQRGVLLRGERYNPFKEYKAVLKECYFGPFEREIIFSPSLLQNLLWQTLEWQLDTTNTLRISLKKRETEQKEDQSLPIPTTKEGSDLPTQEEQK